MKYIRDGMEHDSVAEAKTRACMIAYMQNRTPIFMVQRTWVPTWLAHLVRGTKLEGIAYYED